MNIEQKVIDATIEIKEVYYGDPNMDSPMSDLDKGKLEAYRKVLNWFSEERNEMAKKEFEADKAVEELDDNIGFDDQQETGEVKEGEPNI